ncbi:MAG: hypothetical protein QM844_16515, partial [Planctomycetota bacterium]|nr:hypothetical protein [Planctomycetota bacterium]
MPKPDSEKRPDQLGPYRILRTLGRGGMGVVYQGVNLQTEETVAVKVLAAGFHHDTGLRQRFEVE